MQSEARLTKTALTTGLTHLRKADFGDVGGIYTGLAQLAVGMERLMKLCLILDFQRKNDLRNPTKADLKAYSHNLTSQFEACRRIGVESGMKLDRWPMSDREKAPWAALKVISDFAINLRYYNLDGLTESPESKSPIAQWAEVQWMVVEDNIRYSRRQKIAEEVRQYCDRWKLHGWIRSYDDQFQLQIDHFMRIRQLYLANGYMIWNLMLLLCPLYFLLDHLVDAVHEIEQGRVPEINDVPYLTEFFPFLLADKQSCLRRKTWTFF